MMTVEEIIIVVGFAGLPIGLITAAILWAVVDTLRCNYYERKYPELFELIEKRNELQSKASDFWFTKIDKTKMAIDATLKNQTYYTKEHIKRSNMQLEELRKQLEELEPEYDILVNEVLDLKVKIEDIIKSDVKLLKFMQSRGWCKDDE